MKNYLPTLDGWRAIAIVVVILAHGADSIANLLNSYNFFNAEHIKHLGKEGVNIFFGLSGFLITSRLILEEKTFDYISIKSFYIRRFFRILPAAFLFISIIGILSLFGLINLSLNRWLSTVFFLANYTSAEINWYLGHFWSLAVEEHFYFLWPFAFLLLASNNKRVIFIVSLALFIAFWRALDFRYQITGSSAAVFWGRTDIQVDNILWGVAIALAYSDYQYKKYIDLLLGTHNSFIFLISILILMVFMPTLNWKIEFFFITVKAIIIPLLILWTTLNNSSVISKMLEIGLIKTIGKLSYSLYLWQQLFLVWNVDKISSFMLLQSFPLNLLAAFACAIMSYFLIEKPLINFGHKLAKKRYDR